MVHDPTERVSVVLDAIATTDIATTDNKAG
jgi:hypothetical protein